MSDQTVNTVNTGDTGATGTCRGGRRPLLALLVLTLAGCATPTVDESLTATTGGAAFSQQMAFWSQLHDQPVVSNDDGLHALLLSFRPQDEPAGDYAGRVEAMRAAGLLPDGFVGAADEALTRGTLAVAIARYLDLDGGVMMRLLGPTPRYATRELQYVGVFPPSSPQQVVSGAQLVAILGRMEDYARREQQFRPADELPEGVAPEVPAEAPADVPAGV